MLHMAVDARFHAPIGMASSCKGMYVYMLLLLLLLNRHLFRSLQLESVSLVHRVCELAEGVGHLPPLHEHLKPFRVAGLGPVRLRQRAHLLHIYT